VDVVEYLSGFYEQEHDGIRPFRWMRREATLTVRPQNGDWLLFEVGHPGSFPVRLRLEVPGYSQEFTCINGWQQLAYDCSSFAERQATVSLSCDSQHDAPEDGRELSLMFGNAHVSRPSAFAVNSLALHVDLFRETRLASRPTFLTFETSAVCNMRCAMCVVDPRLKRYKAGRSKNSDKIDYLYDELLPYASKTQWHATGEVLTGPNFWKALDKTRPHSAAHSLEVEIFTNGQLLTSEFIARLLNSPLTDLVVSMDAATAKTYRRIRGGDFDNLLHNVGNLLRANQKGGCLRITLAMVLMRENVEELTTFIELAKSMQAETVTFWPLFAVGMPMPPRTASDGFVFYYPQQMLINYPRLTSRMIDAALDMARRLGVRVGVTPCFSKDYRHIDREDLPYPLPVDEFRALSETSIVGEMDAAAYKNCYLPWNTAFITTEGRFSPCLLMTYLGGIDSVIGKDFHKEVWNSLTMQSLRQAVIDGVPHELCRNAQCIFVNKLY
jgi:MoaA/NifB/PqqE/SkfB family radical SAM enzyme